MATILNAPKFFGAAYFTDFKFSCRETHAGGLLEKIATSLATDKLQPADFDDEFYFSFALSVVKDYSLVIHQLHQIPGIKFGTKKWLLQKLADGKEYLDENFTSDLSVAQAAKHAGIAQFHFYRLYKAVYGLSPWQYILHRRLAFARSLLQTQGVGIGEAALLSGFADVYSFSKAFKKRYNHPPSKLQRLI
jgi:AraC-like DNA-binding protein